MNVKEHKADAGTEVTRDINNKREKGCIYYCWMCEPRLQGGGGGKHHQGDLQLQNSAASLGSGNQLQKE